MQVLDPVDFSTLPLRKHLSLRVVGVHGLLLRRGLLLLHPKGHGWGRELGLHHVLLLLWRVVNGGLQAGLIPVELSVVSLRRQERRPLLPEALLRAEPSLG